MNENPFVVRSEPISEDQARAVVAIVEAYSNVWEKLQLNVTDPRLRAVAVTELQKSCAMAVMGACGKMGI